MRGSWDREPGGDSGLMMDDYEGTEVADDHFGPVPLEEEFEGMVQPAGGVVPQADEMAPSAVVFSFPPQPPAFEGSMVGGVASAEQRPHAEKSMPGFQFSDESVSGMGSFLVQRLLEVLPLRSKLTGRESTSAMLPLPTSKEVLLHLWPETPEVILMWVLAVCLSLNSIWGGSLHSDKQPSEVQRKALNFIRRDVERFCQLDLKMVGIDWRQFFSVRGVDYKGDAGSGCKAGRLAQHCTCSSKRDWCCPP